LRPKEFGDFVMRQRALEASFATRFIGVASIGLLAIIAGTISASGQQSKTKRNSERDSAISSKQSSELRQAPITVQPNIGTSTDESDVQFDPQGRYVAVREESLIKLWDIRSGRPLRILEHTAYFEHFVIIEDGQRILSVHKDGQVRIWEPLTGELVHSAKLPGIEGGTVIYAVAHIPLRNMIVVTPQGGPVVVWDYRKRQAVQTVSFGSSKERLISPQAATLSEDGTVLVAAGSFQNSNRLESSGVAIELVDIRTKRTARTIKLRTGSSIIGDGVLDEKTFVIKAGDDDCDADLVLVNISDREPTYRTIDTAPGCKKKSDGTVEDSNSYKSIKVFYRDKEKLLYIARKGVHGLKVWDVAGQRPGAVAEWWVKEPGNIVGINRGFSLVAVADEERTRVLKFADGSGVGGFATLGGSGAFAIAAFDGTQMMLHRQESDAQHLTVWPVEGVTPTFHRVRLPDGFSPMDAAPVSNLILGSDGKEVFTVHSILSGEQVARFSLPTRGDVQLARLSPNGKWMWAKVYPDQSKVDPFLESGVESYLIDVKTGKVLFLFKERTASSGNGIYDKDSVTSFAFSADGSQFAVGWINGGAEVWSMDALRLIRRLDRAEDQTTSLIFSPDGRFLVGGSRDAGIFVWNTQTGKLVRTLDRAGVAGHVSTASVAMSDDDELIAAGPGQRAVSSGDEGRERRIQVWDRATGKRRYFLSGHEGNVDGIIFTKDGRWIVSGSADGTVRYWHRKTGKLGATFAASLDGNWVIVTENGFFAASSHAGDLLSVVRDFDATNIYQMWQSLYAPDLVREFLAGDPTGEVKSATAGADLYGILASGPAPLVDIVSPVAGTASTSELVGVEARVTDRGKGIGRIEWRANGVTVAVGSAPSGYAGTPLRQEIPLEPGENIIEVLAYNADNLMASLPARTTIKLAASGALAKPKLHVLAIGINAYVDTGWTPPGKTRRSRFAPLTLAVKDATTFAADIKRAAGALYDEVKVTVALDQDATRENLVNTFNRLAKEVHPRDTFVLYAAAHGTTENGRFYLIPPDYQGGPDALSKTAIGQDQLQAWLANSIKASKALILLDTCQSGALVEGYLRARVEASASEAAIGRLHEATGRPVLTAAATGKPALEGYNEHGVFTWALLDALRHGDANGNGTIELSELVAHVQDLVPKISAELQGFGRAETVVRQSLVLASSPGAQTARFGSRGEDFVFVQRLR
jgi:WD40 repeat protein